MEKRSSTTHAIPCVVSVQDCVTVGAGDASTAWRSECRGEESPACLQGEAGFAPNASAVARGTCVSSRSVRLASSLPSRLRESVRRAEAEPMGRGGMPMGGMGPGPMETRAARTARAADWCAAVPYELKADSLCSRRTRVCVLGPRSADCGPGGGVVASLVHARLSCERIPSMPASTRPFCAPGIHTVRSLRATAVRCTSTKPGGRGAASSAATSWSGARARWRGDEPHGPDRAVGDGWPEGSPLPGSLLPRWDRREGVVAPVDLADERRESLRSTKARGRRPDTEPELVRCLVSPEKESGLDVRWRATGEAGCSAAGDAGRGAVRGEVERCGVGGRWGSGSGGVAALTAFPHATSSPI
mmetsp:Transcript_18539/g.58596  ORF Transcript_18539/g.58596 Transcript_18539/m.58596 type:complete len:359 (-) Transcript_18539:446-1522(-)